MTTSEADLKREHILWAVWALAPSDHDPLPSVKDIAQAAGVSRTLLYYYFPTRAELGAALVNRRWQVGGWQRALDKSETAFTFAESVQTFLLECLKNVHSAQTRSYFRLVPASTETEEVKYAVGEYSTLARSTSMQLVRNGLSKGLIREPVNEKQLHEAVLGIAWCVLAGAAYAPNRRTANEIALGIRLVAAHLGAIAVRANEKAGGDSSVLRPSSTVSTTAAVVVSKNKARSTGRPVSCRNRGRPLKSEAPEDRRAEIIEAALDLWSDEEVARWSLESIAERAGVSRTNIYHYFSSRIDLVRDVLRERVMWSWWRDVMEESADEPFAVRVMALMSPTPEYRAAAIRMTRAYSAFVNTASEDSDIRLAMSRLVATLRRDLEQVVLNAQEAGDIPADTQPREMVAAILGLVWMTSAGRAASNEPSVTNQVEGAVDFLSHLAHGSLILSPEEDEQ